MVALIVFPKRTLLPEDELPVGWSHVKVEIDFGLNCKETVGTYRSEQIHQKIMHASVSGMDKLRHIL